jgi:hypothetical protein
MEQIEMWLFLLISLIIPLVVLAISLFMIKSWPKKMHWATGLRTRLAMKNQETWEYANKLSGKLDVPVCIILILTSVGIAIFTQRAPYMLGILVVAQLVVMIMIAIISGAALRKEFDKNGERRR